DAADRAAAFGYTRRGVVRASGAEMRQPLDFGHVHREVPLLLLEEAHALLDVAARIEPLQAFREHARDARGRELPGRGQDPLAALVLLADDQRPQLRLPVVELLLQLILDE